MPTILDDIIYLETQKMTQAPDGGGRVTAIELDPNQPNQVFPKVRKIYRIIGQTEFAAIGIKYDVESTLIAGGCYTYLRTPSDDPYIHTLLFDTDDPDDTLEEAREYAAAYLISGIHSQMRLLGNHVKGQSTLNAFQEKSLPVPREGDVYELSEEEGEVQTQNQFVRIRELDHELQNFSTTAGNTERRVLSMTLYSSLNANYQGIDPTPYDDFPNDPVAIRKTTVADAARFYGIMQVTEAVTPGNFSVKVDSIYKPIASATTIPTVLTDIQGGENIANLLQGSSTQRTNLTATASSFGIDEIFVMNLARALFKGSIIVTVAGYDYTDDEQGGLTPDPGANAIDFIVDHVQGIITAISKTAFAGEVIFTVAAIGSVNASTLGHTVSKEVTINNLGTAFNLDLDPPPKPRTLKVYYFAQNNRYLLEDLQGIGTLEGDGIGNVNYLTSSLGITTSDQPDIGSWIVAVYSADVHYTYHDGVQTLSRPLVRHVSAFQGWEPGSCTVSYYSGGELKQCTDPNGVWEGDGEGIIDHAAGISYLKPDFMPDPQTNFVYDFNYGTAQNESHEVSVDGGGFYTITANNGPITPSTGKLRWNVSYTEPTTGVTHDNSYEAIDDGLGGLTLIFSSRESSQSGFVDEPMIGASVNYSTGVFYFKPTRIVTLKRWDKVNKEWIDHQVNETVGPGTRTVFVDYKQAGGAQTTEQETVPTPPLEIDLVPGTNQTIYPQGIDFELAGKRYVDFDGTVYADPDPVTGLGTPAGTVNYLQKKITLTNFLAGDYTITLNSLVTVYGQYTVTETTFLTVSAPIQPSSFIFEVTAADGTLITGSTDANGVVINADYAEGRIIQAAGVVNIRFGNYQDLGQGLVWVEKEVFPNTLRYSCVQLKYFPQDGAQLGIPVDRLRLDGLVSICRPGYILVLFHLETEPLPSPLTSGQVVTLNRGNLLSVTLYDDNDVIVDSNLYTADLEIGEITFADPLILGDLIEPLYAVTRIGETVRCYNALVDGTVQLFQAITGNYPIGSYLSSCVYWGDIYAYQIISFFQQTDQGGYSDILEGDEADPIYDLVNYPMSLSNRHSITERWKVEVTGASTFKLHGESQGLVISGNTSSDLAPLNPWTGEPMLTLSMLGFNAPLTPGNIWRFNTIGAIKKLWNVRVTLSGPSQNTSDRYELETHVET